MRHGPGRAPLANALVLIGLAGATSCSRPVSNSTNPTLDLGSSVQTMTGAQLWDFLVMNEIKWAHGPTDKRKCGLAQERNCQARFDMAYLDINGQAVRPDPWNGTANGTIVGRIVNYGSTEGGSNDAEFVYKAERRGGKRHFVVVATNRQNKREYWVRRVTPNDASTAAVSWGPWINCEHTTGPRSPKSRFASCNEVHATQGNGASAAVLQSHELSPGWMECESSGCCTAGQ